MKYFLFIFVTLLLLSSCAEDKMMRIDGKDVLVEAYGIANVDTRKNDRVEYEISAGSVVCAVIFCETIIAPIYIIGWDLYEPYKVKE